MLIATESAMQCAICALQKSDGLLCNDERCATLPQTTTPASYR